MHGSRRLQAPERIAHDTVKPASDALSVRVVLYKLLADRMPWTAKTTTGLMTEHVFTDPNPYPYRRSTVFRQCGAGPRSRTPGQGTGRATAQSPVDPSLRSPAASVPPAAGQGRLGAPTMATPSQELRQTLRTLGVAAALVAALAADPAVAGAADAPAAAPSTQDVVDDSPRSVTTRHEIGGTPAG